jgi:nitrite reductase (NO-forming)
MSSRYKQYETEKRVTRRSLMEKTLLASGFIAGGAIAGTAYSVFDNPGANPVASAQQAEPGPTLSGKVTEAHPAALEPVATETTKQLTLEAVDATVEIGAGVQYNAWTFDGHVPGPVVHVRQGDTVDFTLVNNGSAGHSIDFHAAQIPWDVNYKTIVPGDSLSFKWTADLPGVFMYHCGTAPVLHHIANGMYGAIVVDPSTPLQPATEYVLVQSEFYAKAGVGDLWVGDMDKMKAATPDLLAFNGVAFQYRDNPLPATAGERIRLYVVNAGPTLFSAFHVIGALFDKVYIDGNPANLLRGVQTYTVPPGGGSVFELIIPNAGLYPFVTHNFAYTELGAVGLLQVT